MLNSDPTLRDPLAGLSGFQGRGLLPFLIEHAPTGIAVVRPHESEGTRDWRYVLANPAYCAIPRTPGMPIPSAEPLVGRTVREIFPTAAAQRIIESLGQVQRTGQAAQFHEFEANLGPGRERTWWNVAHHPLFDAAGQVAAVLILIDQVTDQVLARQDAEVLASEAESERRRLLAVMQALPVGVAITDARGGYVQVNGAYERIWGGPHPGLDSLSDYDTVKAWWADTGWRVAPEEWASAQAVLKGATVMSQVMEIERFDGARAFIINSSAPLRDAAGDIVGSVVAIQDITPLRQAEKALERALVETEEASRTLDALMTYVPEGITIADAPDMTIRMVSRYGQEALGGTHQGVTPAQAAEQWPIYQPDGRTPMPEEGLPLVRAIQHGEVVRNVELVQLNAQGQPLHLLCNAAPIRDASGDILGGVVAWRDVTEMRATQDALRASEERYRTLFETLNEGLALHEMIYDAQGKPYDYRFLEVNPAFERQTGLTAAQVVGHTVREVIPNIEPLWIERYGRVAQSGEPASFEEYSQPLGRWYDVRAYRTQPDRFAVLFLDVTARRRTEQALRESEERLRLATDAAGVGTWDRDLRTGQTYWSASHYRLLGYEPAPDGQALMEAWLSRLHPDDRERIIQGMDAARRERSLYSDEYRILRADDGRLAWMRVFGRYVYDATGAAVRFVGVALDTTAQREAQEALRVANETLEQRVAQRTALAEQRAVQLRALAVELTRAEEQERRRLAGLLHDHLQQLLAAAALQLHVAQPRAAQEAQPSLRQALDLLNEAIAASRSLTAELSPVILHDAGLVPALHWLGRWMFQHHGLQVTVEAPEGEASEAETAGAVSKSSLREEIATLLFHSTRELLFNVVKHAGVDQARVELSYPNEDTIQLVVADKGRGFSPDAIPPVSLGGFGLFSIRERLAYMGGEFIVEGGPGQGTRVMLRVPTGSARQTANAAAPTPEQEQAGLVAETGTEAPRKLRLMVVDDHLIVRKGLVGLLNAEPDLEVVGEAGDGLEAIARVRELEPDIVLMDLNMPRMDGIEATRRILAEYPRVRVIVLSMFDDSEKRALMQQVGATAYVAKGGNPASLVAAVRAAREA